MTKCSKCGETVEENIKFCPDCGTKIKHEQIETQSKQASMSTHVKWLSLGIIIAVISAIIIVTVIDSRMNIKSGFGGGAGKEVIETLHLPPSDSFSIHGFYYRSDEMSWLFFAIVSAIIINILAIVIFYFIISKKF